MASSKKEGEQKQKARRTAVPLRSGVYAVTKAVLKEAFSSDEQRISADVCQMLQDYTAAFVMKVTAAAIAIGKDKGARTLAARDVQCAVVSALSGSDDEFRKIALARLTLAETAYRASIAQPTTAAGTATKAKRAQRPVPAAAKPVRTESRANLKISVSAIRAVVKHMAPGIAVGRSALIAMSAVAQYVLEEILRGTVEVLRSDQTEGGAPVPKTVMRKHVTVAVSVDRALAALFASVAHPFAAADKSMASPYLPKAPLVLLAHKEKMEAERMKHAKAVDA